MQNLETKRLLLREFLLTDLEDFYTYAKNPKVGPMAGWKPHETREDTLEILRMFRKKEEVYAIYHKDHKKVIGSVGVHRKSLEGVYEIGYVLSEDYWGQGIVVEACNEVIRHCFEEKEVVKLLVEHFEENNQSKRVIEKLGFTYIEYKEGNYTDFKGEKKNCLVYKMERNEYNAKTKGNL